MNTSSPLGRPLSALALVVIALPLLAGCGGASAPASDGVATIAAPAGSTAGAPSLTTGATPTAAPRTAADREAVLLKAAQCMRDNGIKSFPDPTVDSNGNVRLQGLRGLERQDPLTRKAFTICQPLFRQARPQFSPADRQRFQDAMLAFARCVRAHGFSMPDPTFGAPPTPGAAPGADRGGPFGGINRDDPKYKAARTACQSILAAARPPGAGGGGFGGPGG